MLPLAIASTDAMVKRLGFVKWKQLHRVAYAAGVLGVVDAIRHPKPRRGQSPGRGAATVPLTE